MLKLFSSVSAIVPPASLRMFLSLDAKNNPGIDKPVIYLSYPEEKLLLL